MPRKALKQKKQIQISDDEAPVRRKFNRQAQNEARQLRALNRNFAAMAMNNSLLDGMVEDGQQPRVQQPVRRTLGDYTTPRVTGFQSAIAPPGIEANTWELKTGSFRWCRIISSQDGLMKTLTSISSVSFRCAIQ
ncbi:unnamed protein product [Rhodiola kirilowii]